MRNLRRFALIAFVICCATLAVCAATQYSEGYFHYTVKDDSVTITDYFGKDKSVHVPSSIAGYPVSVIETGAFPSGTSVKKLYLPDTIMEIHDNAIADTIEVTYVASAAGNSSSGDGSAETGLGKKDSTKDSGGKNSESGTETGSSNSKDGKNSGTEAGESGEEGTAGDSESVEAGDDLEGDIDYEEHETTLDDTSQNQGSNAPIRIIGLIVIIAAIACAGYFIYRKRSKRDED